MDSEGQIPPVLDYEPGPPRRMTPARLVALTAGVVGAAAVAVAVRALWPMPTVTTGIPASTRVYWQASTQPTTNAADATAEQVLDAPTTRSAPQAQSEWDQYDG
jgi:hypothetical protein